MSDHRDASRTPAPLPSWRGAVVVLDGEFESLPRESLTRRLAALGADVRADLAADVTLLVVGNRTRALAALLGPSALERRARALADAGQRIAVWTEDELSAALAHATEVPDAPSAPASADAPDAALAHLLATLRDGDPAARVSAAEALGARGDRRAARALLDATRDAPHARWVAATVALCRVGGDEAFAHAVASLRDPRSADRAVRRELVHAIEARGDGDALGALAETLHAVHGAFGAEESAAFGRLVARGVRRYADAGHAAPCAVEWEDGPEARTPEDLVAFARRAGVLEVLRDAAGAVMYRVTLERLEPPRAGGEAPPGYELLQRAGRRRGARVWLGGCSLPAALPAACWLALLGPLNER